jgi:WD40 repeat protein
MTVKRDALIVATGKYRDPKLPELHGPRQDAIALRRVLGDTSIGNFEVDVALNSRVHVLRQRLEAFFADRARDDVLLLHMSCHGIKDTSGQLYFAATDTQVKLLHSTGIDADWVRRLMDRSRSKSIVLLLDCCFGGAFAAGIRRSGVAEGADIQGRFAAADGSGRVVITASDSLQYAFEGATIQGKPQPSVFTRTLVHALETGAADKDADSEISVTELYDFVLQRMRAESPDQLPLKWEFGVTGGVMIAANPNAPPSNLAGLPESIRNALASSDTLLRLGAVVELSYLARGDDQRARAKAIEALKKLAGDDSTKVKEAAGRLASELTSVVAKSDPSRTRTVSTRRQEARRQEVRLPRPDRNPPPRKPTPRKPPDRAGDSSEPERSTEHSSIEAQWKAAVEVARVRHTVALKVVLFSPDGSRIASAGAESKPQISSTQTGAVLTTLDHGSLKWVRAMAFSPDGQFLVTGGDAPVRRWHISPLGNYTQLAHTGVNAIAFSASGSIMATGGDDGYVRIWATTSGLELGNVKHGSKVRAVALNLDLRLASGADDMTARLWDIRGFADPQEVATVRHGNFIGVVRKVAFSPDGVLWVSGGDSRTVRVCRAESGVVVAELVHGTDFTSVKDLAFSPDGRYLATGDDSGVGSLWDLQRSPPQKVAHLQHGGSVNSIAFHPSGKLVATGSSDATAVVWSVPIGERMAVMKHDGSVDALTFDATGGRLATGSSDLNVRVWASVPYAFVNASG